MDKQKINYTLEEYKAIRDKIDEILFTFDFDKVANVMKLLDWKWNVNGNYVLPSAMEIREAAYHLLVKAAENRYDVSSGGLEVHCGIFFIEQDEDSQDYDVDLTLKFVIESVK